jgi:hypothetical protein
MTGTNGDETVQVWLVERGYTNRDLITLVYATPDGERSLRREQAATTLGQGSPITAAREVDPDRLSPVTDGETVERYRTEVERTRDGTDPDDPI